MFVLLGFIRFQLEPQIICDQTYHNFCILNKNCSEDQIVKVYQMRNKKTISNFFILN